MNCLENGKTKNNIVMRRIRNMEQMYAQFTAEIWDSLSSDEVTAIEYREIATN